MVQQDRTQGGESDFNALLRVAGAKLPQRGDASKASKPFLRPPERE